MSQLILYDLAGMSPCRSWSGNPWKIRLVLNYKGIDYKTEFVPLHKVNDTIKALGVPENDMSNPSNRFSYTVPAVRFPDGTCMQNSWKIVHELEKRYPSPALPLDDSALALQALVGKMFLSLAPNILIKTRDICGPESEEYWLSSRTKMVGMTPQEFYDQNGGEGCWQAAEPHIKEMASMISKGAGPFNAGKTPSYMEFIVVALEEFFKRLDPAMFERFMAYDAAYPRVYEASKPWLVKDD